MTAMVTRVKAKLEAILGKTLHVRTQGYIESITHVRQLPHRDLPAASLPVDGVALSVFWALLMDIPDDDVSHSSSPCVPVPSLGPGSSTACQ